MTYTQRSVCGYALHREALAGTGLAVRKDGAIETVHDALDNGAGGDVIDLPLCRPMAGNHTSGDTPGCMKHGSCGHILWAVGGVKGERLHVRIPATGSVYSDFATLVVREYAAANGPVRKQSERSRHARHSQRTTLDRHPSPWSSSDEPAQQHAHIRRCGRKHTRAR